MTREALINKTLGVLSKLPADKAGEIADFADYIQKKYEEETLQQGIEKIVSESNVFDYLKEEPDIYTPADLKEKYQ